MTWRVVYSKKALKQLAKMGVDDSRRVVDWMAEHVDGCENPRVHGKGLTANRSGEWRYRVGDWRVLCFLDDGTVTVDVFRVAHRSEAYA